MLDVALLRRDFGVVADNLQRRGITLNEAAFSALDQQRRQTQEYTETLRAKRNAQTKQISADKASGKITTPEDFKTPLQQAQQEMNQSQAALDKYLYDIPNLLHKSVPDGLGEQDNVKVRCWGKPPSFDFVAKDHTALGEALQLINFDDAVKLAAARFVILAGPLARLHRVLAQFMLNLHVDEHGCREMYVPYLANPATLTGTGQLPKFEEDLFFMERDALYLIPTAEVALTNLVRDRLISPAELPLRLVSHTPCFRREAGSYGKDTRGMLRQHQFDKVELVSVCTPEESYRMLEEMTTHACRVLELLELPYRVVSLCGGDIGFAAAKTYDIEVWLPGQQCYREISSCSNCEDFQARRMKARYRQANGKPALLHTLNGSGVAVGRALIAVMENYQQADGSINIPDVLRPLMGNMTRITRENNG